MAFNVAVYNVLMLGFGFMFVFTAFQTMGNIEKTMLDSIHNDDKTFNGVAYYSLSIIYIVFALANWLTPSAVSMMGERLAMVVGGVFYAAFIASFLWPQGWLLYVASVVVGLGAALIWTAQGSSLTQNSTPDTMSRNSGLFWAMLQCSLFIGNLFVFFEFTEVAFIPKVTRDMVTGVLLALAVLGILFLIALRPPPPSIRSSTEAALAKNVPVQGPVQALKDSIRLFITKDMLLLSATFFYTGVELSFFSGVYGASLGGTQDFRAFIEPKRLVGLSGIFTGVGEVLGGASFGLLGRRTSRYGRDPIVMLGFLLHIVAFFCIFCNIPNEAPLSQNTYQHAFLHSNPYLAIICSFMLGLGDSCYNTQLYSLLGSAYSQNSAPAFALFKFMQSLAAAICFFYTQYASLYVQLGVLVVFAVLGTATFCLVEWSVSIRNHQNTNAKDTSCIENIKEV